MKKDAVFEILKDIPIGGGKFIKKGSTLNRTHGVYYLEGNLLAKDYQEDFDNLIEQESLTKWNYICPIVTKVAFDTNGKKEKREKINI